MPAGVGNGENRQAGKGGESVRRNIYTEQFTKKKTPRWEPRASWTPFRSLVLPGSHKASSKGPALPPRAASSSALHATNCGHSSVAQSGRSPGSAGTTGCQPAPGGVFARPSKRALQGGAGRPSAADVPVCMGDGVFPAAKRRSGRWARTCRWIRRQARRAAHLPTRFPLARCVRAPTAAAGECFVQPAAPPGPARPAPGVSVGRPPKSAPGATRESHSRAQRFRAGPSSSSGSRPRLAPTSTAAAAAKPCHTEPSE